MFAQLQYSFRRYVIVCKIIIGKISKNPTNFLALKFPVYYLHISRPVNISRSSDIGPTKFPSVRRNLFQNKKISFKRKKFFAVLITVPGSLNFPCSCGSLACVTIVAVVAVVTVVAIDAIVTIVTVFAVVTVLTVSLCLLLSLL